MKPGARVTVNGRAGVVKALRPGNSVDVQFDGDPFTTRHDANHVVALRSNPGPRGGLTPSEREALSGTDFALSGRRFPINDRRHAVIAMQYILRGFVGEGDAPLVLQAIHKKYPPSDRRNAEIWAFFQKHRQKLLQPKKPRRAKTVRTAANPQQDVYNIFKEHLRAQVQGVYESQVRSHLGLPSGTPFKDARGRRLDESLDSEEKRELFGAAQAITTRQQQKYGYLVPGTQDPTQKGINRALERLSDPAKAEENRQDYERTLAMLRKSGHYRVVAEIVKGQKRFIVQPRPPEDLIKIPDYRLSEEKAREDANRAEAAFQSAPKALKARANPYYTTVYGSTARPFDFDDTPAKTTVKKGDTIAKIAKRLGVSPPEELVRYGRLETKDAAGNWVVQPPLRWLQQATTRGGLYTPPEARISDPMFWQGDVDEELDETLAGARVRKDLMIAEFERRHGAAAFKYATKQERDAAAPTVVESRQQAIRAENAVREAKRQEAELLRQLAEAEREAARTPKIVQLGSKAPADMTREEIQIELDRIRDMPGWQAYVRQQQHAESVSKTVSPVKGGKAVFDGAARALADAVRLIGAGVIGYGADSDEKFRIGTIVVDREAALSLDLRSERHRVAERTSAGNAYKAAGLSDRDAGIKYRADATVVRETNVSLLRQAVDRFTQQGALAEQYEASEDKNVGVRLGRALKGRGGIDATEEEALRLAEYALEAYKDAKEDLAKYAQAKARIASVSAEEAERYKKDTLSAGTRARAAQAAEPSEGGGTPQSILDLDREGASEKSVLNGLEAKAAGAGELYKQLVAGVIYVSDLQQTAAAGTPEQQAAAAAAIEEHIRRNVNGPSLLTEVISRLAPGRVIVVYVDQKSKYDPTKYVLPAAYLAPALYKPKDSQLKDGSFTRSAVWNTLLAKADARFGDHIAVYEDYDQAVAAVKGRIERLTARGTPRTLQLAQLYQTMLDAGPAVYGSLQFQRDQYLRDTGQAPPSRFRSGPSEGYMRPGTARGAAREASGSGVEAQREVMRRVVSSIEAERALDAARALELKGAERPSLESFFAAEQQAKAAVVTRLQSEGRALDAVDAARQYIASGAMRLNEFLNTNFRSEVTSAKRRQDISEAALNTLRERLLGPRKKRAMTPSERKQRQLPGAEVPTRAFYDLEFVFDPKTQAPEVRYVMYVPRVLQYIQKTEQALGGVVLAEPESYVRFKQGAPERGPSASAAPPPDTYQKVSQEIADARVELNEAKSKGGPMTVVRALRKLKKAIGRERRYKRALIGANTPYSIVGTEVIRGGRKVALFTDPTGGVVETPKQISDAEKERKREDTMLDEDDYFAQMEGLEAEFGPGSQKSEAEMRQESIYAQSQSELEAALKDMPGDSFTKKIVTPKEAWLEDKSFIAELSRSASYDPATGRFVVADDRKKYAKYYTTNPRLAYYTIMLWNTPELFNGAVVFLPVPIKDDQGNYFDVIQTSDVFSDNPKNDAYKVYNDLLANEILLRSDLLIKLIKAKTPEDVEAAARLYVALYGAPQTDREPRKVGYAEAVTRIVRGLEPLDSAKAIFGVWGYERKRRDALNMLLEKERAAMTVLSFPDVPEAKREEIKQRLEQLQAAREKLTQIASTLTFDATPLGRMFIEGKIEALAFGEEDSPEILEAWKAGARGIKKALQERVEEFSEMLQGARNLPEAERRLIAQSFDNFRDTLGFFDRLTAGEAQFVKKNRGA